MKKIVLLLLLPVCSIYAQPKKKTVSKTAASTAVQLQSPDEALRTVKFRNIGPFRGGRSVTATGVSGNDKVYYMGTTGGGVWKTADAGLSWTNISDGYFNTGSVGAVAVAESDPNVIYVGMGEHAPRGVMTSYGDGVYKSTDAGKTWKHIGLSTSRQIATIRIHPSNPDILYVAVQGALNGPSEDRGIYQSVDGGTTWKKILYVNESTGCSDLSMDPNNPRILYAAMWEHHRLPWEVKSGGPGSGLYKSTDAGLTWNKIENGLPKEKGKMAVTVARSNPDKVYALVESDTEKELGGLFVSNDAGASFNRVSKDHRLTTRAWYYVEVFTDPQNENIVHSLGAEWLKSIDGGQTWKTMQSPHGDFHQLWFNPANPQNLILADDGGAYVSFNGGNSWSPQNNQPTAQLYRINADNLFPYHLYAGQQDNTSVVIESRNTWGSSIGERNWFYSAGGESAFLAFDPDHPKYVMGGSYQGTIELLDQEIREGKGVMVVPLQYQSIMPKEMRYRFNWNAPIIWSKHEPGTFYHAGNRLFKTSNLGKSWTVASPDLTRHDTSKMGRSGIPYTNEGAGGENYGTISYVIEAPDEKGVIWTGSDDGLVHVTRDNGATWLNVTPAGLPECLVNSIEVSPHEKGTVYIACTRYKMNDLAPMLYRSRDYGKSWTRINDGIPVGAYTRVIREDNKMKGLLFAGTETGLYISWDNGNAWTKTQLGLPVTPITDLKIHQNNLVAATMGRAFWILDDLYMVRNYGKLKSVDTFQLFGPDSVYRLGGGSSLDAPGSTDDPKPATPGFEGTNAPVGAVLYYAIPAGSDSVKVSLTIKNAKGEVVRRYYDSADQKFVEFPGGPAAAPVLPKKPGLNRFVWDQRYSVLPGVPTAYMEGSWLGHRAPPGNYMAEMTFNKTTVQHSFIIRPDPRISASSADYDEQHLWLTKVEDGLRDLHGSVLQLRVAKKQVADLLDLIGDKPAYAAVKKSATSLQERMNKWEEALVQNRSKSYDDIINFVNKLGADYFFLKGEMDSNMPFVTDGQKEQFQTLNATWMPLKSEFNSMVNTAIPELNALCRSLGIERVMMPVE
ncbi:WD40/YVTN/BNR-like repeat-containing protein [Flavihumibacter fluvii]|uniref:WD40/YVTN/BNR-like repeat-containing protein n=1 Tax=Flavihumibacter fluvii TaxID=2838157 RepID=UPI001BDE6A44|nr:hypothetical protein [Flavihumibacter fluvii]ULQ52357.1 hypothetical protein KJS93_19910 [Flavihumibacter fluvii]